MNYPLYFNIANLYFKLCTNNKLFYNLILKKYSNFLIKNYKDFILLNVLFKPNYTKKYKKNFSNDAEISYNTVRTDTIINIQKKQCDIYSLIEGKRLFLVFSQSLKFIFNVFNNNKNLILFHSASILFKNKIFVFSGNSGEGKSTLSSIIKKNGGVILNDELNILEYKKDKVFLKSTPILGDHKSHKFKGIIKQIVFINKSTNNKIKKLSKKEFIQRIISQEYTNSFNECHIDLKRKDSIKTIFNICKSINAYELYFKKNDSFLSLLSCLN